MEFVTFRDLVIRHINEYKPQIKISGKVSNFITFNKHICQLLSSWNDDTDCIRRQITETFNEICFVHYLVTREECMIKYEPVVGESGKSIDLLVQFDSKKIYMDIKTIQPQDLGVWQDFIDAKNEGRIDGNVDLFKDGMGGTLWHKMTASRAKFSEYSLELESKIKELNDPTSYYYMVFCSNGFDWHESELEDFIEFYRTGHFVSWDHLRSMAKHYYDVKRVTFDRSIHNFTILKRMETSKEYKVIPFVRMENMFRIYVE